MKKQENNNEAKNRSQKKKRKNMILISLLSSIHIHICSMLLIPTMVNSTSDNSWNDDDNNMSASSLSVSMISEYYEYSYNITSYRQSVEPEMTTSSSSSLISPSNMNMNNSNKNMSNNDNNNVVITIAPSTSIITSNIPTYSPSTALTTLSPSISTSYPTLMNTTEPSPYRTTTSPSTAPSVSPSIPIITSIVRQMFSQTYSGSNLKLMEDDQIQGYQVILTLQTQNYGPSGGEPIVTTKCVVNNQELSYSRRLLLSLLYRMHRLLQQSTDTSAVVYDASLRYLEVDFEMTWTSNLTNLTDPSYVSAFVNYMNSEGGKDIIKEQLINLGVAVEVVDNVRLQVPVVTASPSISMQPSITQLPQPTRSMMPSYAPAAIITPQPPSSNISNAIIGIVSAVAAIAIIFLAAIILQRRSSSNSQHRKKRNASHQQQQQQQYDPSNNMNLSSSQHNHHRHQQSSNAPIMRHQHQHSSNHSLLSGNDSYSSVDSPINSNHNNNHHQQHPTAPTITIDISNDSNNSTGIINEQITINPFDDEQLLSNFDDLRWGVTNSSNLNCDPAEIEVSVLWETHDWLKKQEGAMIEDRRLFLLETMNKMLKTVQHNIISDDDATRAIHYVAAMLGLSNTNISEDIPETSIIITGMRKTVSTNDVILAFKEFGDIAAAAVAPKSRGFGLVRYASTKSVQRAMEKFRKEEVVVQDVAVVVRVLSSNMNIIETTPNVIITDVQQQQNIKPKTIALGTIAQQPTTTNHSRNPSSAGSSKSGKSSQRSGLPPVVPT